MRSLLLFSCATALLIASGCTSSQISGADAPCARFVGLEPIGEVDQPPALAEPPLAIEYPALCRRAEISGRVELGFSVTATGQADSVYVTRGIGGGCDLAAHAAIREASFTPARSAAGSPVRAKVRGFVAFEESCQQ